MLTPKEKQTIITLLEMEKQAVSFLTGFGKRSVEDKKKVKFLDTLIDKIK
jgi:hypothetical protein